MSFTFYRFNEFHNCQYFVYLTYKLCYLREPGGPYAGLLDITVAYPAGNMQNNYFCHVPV